MEALQATFAQRSGLAALRLPLLALTALAAALGILMAWSCGCGRDVPAAGATVLLAVLAHAAVQIGRGGAAGDAVAHRDAAQMLGIVVAGGGVWLAARAGPGLAAVGGAGLGLGWIAAGVAAARGDAWRRAVLVAAVGWLLVVGADVAQRQRFDAIAAVAAVGPAVLVAVVSWTMTLAEESATGARRQAAAWAITATLVAAHLWAWGWWRAAWLPTPAVWALGSAVPAMVTAALLLAGAPSRPRWRAPATWALLTAVAHLGGLAAALLAVAALR